MSSVHLDFKKKPALLASILSILWESRRGFEPSRPRPDIVATRNAVAVNRKELARFNEICGTSGRESLPVFYPFTIVYPLVQRMLGRREAPLPITRGLNSRMQVIQMRRIAPEEVLDLACRLTGFRYVEKGFELDLTGHLSVQGEMVWRTILTFYYRGSFGRAEEEGNKGEANGPRPIVSPAQSIKWVLPEGQGLRFARISGDANPIHFFDLYARLLGFERSFAQPLLVLGKIFERLMPSRQGGAVSLDLFFKGPLYYGRQIELRTAPEGSALRFDLYCEGNPRACILGLLNKPG